MNKGWIGAIAGLVVLAGAVYLGLQFYSEAQTRERAETVVRQWRDAGNTVTYKGVDTTSDGGLVIREVVLETPDRRRFAMESVMVAEFDWANPAHPTFVDVTARGVRLERGAAGPEIGGRMRAIGLEELMLDARYAWRWDPKANTFDIRTIRIDGREFGTLTISMKLGNWTRFDLEDRAAMLETLRNATVIAGRVSYRGTAIFDRVVQVVAAVHSVSEAYAKVMIRRDLRDAQRRAKDDRIVDEAIDALIRYTQDPGEIEAVIAPERPVGIATLIPLALLGRNDAKALLGLTIRAR